MGKQRCKHGVETDECAQCFNERGIPVDAYFAELHKPMNRLEDISEIERLRTENAELRERIKALEKWGRTLSEVSGHG